MVSPKKIEKNLSLLHGKKIVTKKAREIHMLLEHGQTLL